MKKITIIIRNILSILALVFLSKPVVDKTYDRSTQSEYSGPFE